MSNISKKLNDAWVKVNEGISNAADSISEASRNRIHEIKLESQKQLLSSELVSAIMELYKKGTELPEGIAEKASELSEIIGKLEKLHPVADEKKKKAETEAPSIHVESDGTIPSDDCSVPAREQTSEKANEESAESVGNQATPSEAAVDVVYEADILETVQPEGMEKAEDTIPDEQHDEEPDIGQETLNEPAKENNTDQEIPDPSDSESGSEDTFEKAGKKVEQILGELDEATDSVFDHIQNSDELKTFQKKAEETEKTVGDVVKNAAQGLDRMAEKAGNALASFLESLSRKTDPGVKHPQNPEASAPADEKSEDPNSQE